MSQMNQPADTFGIALDFVLDHEGGYVHDAADPGGETNFGISRAAHPELDIGDISVETARVIYWQDYWQPARCEALPAPLAVALFDAAVNHGVKTAVKMLQRELPVHADGIIGPKTRKAVHRLDQRRLLVNFLQRRISLYCELAEKNPEQQRFLRGWQLRILDLLETTVPLHV
jgi:lysozyme family protein